VLLTVASRSRHSSPAVRSHAVRGSNQDPTQVLADVYLRLQSREAKWFTRMILKCYTPVVIPEYFTYSSFHYMLPDFLKVHDNFQIAIELLRETSSALKFSMPNEKEQSLGRATFIKDLKPIVGIKVGRQPFLKARSIKHCVDMARNRWMAIEKKYDGEYCQVHIDLSKQEKIKMFSKSGKDSTRDRAKLHGAILECLRIGQPTCAIKSRCILEGELLVYSDKVCVHII